MNPTGIFFIRQSEQERPASQADPATLSSLGIWHRNFNRKATQAGRSVWETHCACQSEPANWCEHSKSVTLLAYWFVTRREKGTGWQGKRSPKGLQRDIPTPTCRSEEGEDGGPGWPGWGVPQEKQIPIVSNCPVINKMKNNGHYRSLAQSVTF